MAAKQDPEKIVREIKRRTRKGDSSQYLQAAQL